jgi:hypothetical protein
MILILDACESDAAWQGGVPVHERLINQAFFVFGELEKNGIARFTLTLLASKFRSMSSNVTPAAVALVRAK